MAEVRELREATILAKCEYFVDVQVWPIHELLDVEGWLGNFTPGDPHALHLLNGFMYYPDRMLNQMVMRSLRQLSPEVCVLPADQNANISKWSDFLDNSLITFPTDDEANPTDSGHDFVRRVREIGIREEQILSPREAVGSLAGGAEPSAVIFIDDFVGTGLQIRGTWRRVYPGIGSFQSIFARSPFHVYYVPLFCTELGEIEVQRDCAEIAVRPLHRLDARYSALNPDEIVWPDSLSATGPEFIRAHSEHTGIPDTGGYLPNDWRGFAQLGLSLAIGRFVPDATLPIFYWKENGWTPLVQRH